MSDIIRRMLLRQNGPVGLGNNPSPFPVPMPDIPEPEKPMTMSQGIRDMMMDGGDRYESGIQDLQRYYEKERQQQQQPQRSRKMNFGWPYAPMGE